MELVMRRAEALAEWVVTSKFVLGIAEEWN